MTSKFAHKKRREIPLFFMVLVLEYKHNHTRDTIHEQQVVGFTLRAVIAELALRPTVDTLQSYAAVVAGAGADLARGAVDECVGMGKAAVNKCGIKVHSSLQKNKYSGCIPVLLLYYTLPEKAIGSFPDLDVPRLNLPPDV